MFAKPRGGAAGVWGIPWGYVEGKLATGDNDPPETAAMRETLEEAGVEAQITGLLGIQNHAAQTGDPRIYMVFLGEHVRGEPHPDGIETDRAMYLSLDQITSWPETIDEFVKWVVLRVLRGEHRILSSQSANPYSPFIGFF